jgi:PAS domain S-box-containing protein
MNPPRDTVLSSPQTVHAVHFYDEDAALIEKVADFLTRASVAILIATPQHLHDIEHRLRNGKPRRLIALDAAETLSRFMRDGWPDERLFDASVGEVVRDACAGGQSVHAFGEMVALLCADGLYEAAIQLEQLWNKLAETNRFSLLCGYHWNLFPTAEFALRFEHVCHEHDRTCSGEHLSPALPGADAQRRIVSLEQKARALEFEVRQRRVAERSLRDKKQEFADFIENAADGLHQVGSDGMILWANKAELHMLGYDWDEYVGRHIADFHVDRPVIDRILRRLKRGETLRDEPARLLCKDGSIKHVSISSNGYFKDGELLYTRCLTRDATARHERDQALQQRDNMLRHAPVAAALLLGPELVFQVANRRYCELMSREDLEGRSFRQAFPELRHSKIMRGLEHVLASGETRTVEEFPLSVERDDASSVERFFTFGMEPLPAEQGNDNGVILIAHDITEHVLARKALEQASRERELLLAELTRANRAKDEFLAMLGHELRNPLSPIVTALELMRLRGDTSTEREQHLIRRQVDHLVRLVDDLLDIARLTRGKIDLKMERVDVAHVVAKAIEMASPLLEQRRHRLVTRVGHSLHVDGDSVRLAQVVSNLLTNAARYTPVGGEIVLSVSAQDGKVAISVKDNGIGIAPDMLPRIFDLFYQGERGIDRSEGGLGIGLALVKNLVEMHGGTVEAKSAGKDAGSEFTVCLSLGELQPHEEETREDALATSSHTDGCRVMIVDDNDDAATALGQLLEKQGHTVQVFNEPLAALAAAAHFAPQAAILDIGLPLIDGYELAERLRAQLGEKPCRLIALSGYGQASDKLKSKAAGFAHHLVKPVQAEMLLSLIDIAADTLPATPDSSGGQ